VFSSLLWTGIDLFMGFVLGPILRRAELPVRREVVRRLTPRTLFLMPTVSIISGTTGWFLAIQFGYTSLEWPAYGWVAAALILVAIMTFQGLGFLTPVNVFVCLELQKTNPDMKRISYWMQRYFYAVALQGTMQVGIIIVMTRFRAGI
jgi:ABC-type dipeptide/oligopeptide/nickel transport system permease component